MIAGERTGYVSSNAQSNQRRKAASAWQCAGHHQPRRQAHAGEQGQRKSAGHAGSFCGRGRLLVIGASPWPNRPSTSWWRRRWPTTTRRFADNVTNSNAVTALLRQGNRMRIVDGGRSHRLPPDLRRGNLRVVHGHRTALPRRQGDHLGGRLRAGQRGGVRHPVRSRPRQEQGPRAHPEPARRQDGQRREHHEEQHHQGHLRRRNGGQVASPVSRRSSPTTAPASSAASTRRRGRSGRTSSRPIARATGCSSTPPSRRAMNALWLKLTRGTEKPDLVARRWRNLRDLRERASGEPALRRRQARSPRLRDPEVQDRRRWSTTAPPPAWSGGYMLNTKYLKFEIYSGRNFEALDLPDQSVRHGRDHQAHRLHGRASP